MKPHLISIKTLEEFKNFFQQKTFPKEVMAAEGLEFEFSDEVLRDKSKLKETYLKGLTHLTDIDFIRKVREIETTPARYERCKNEVVYNFEDKFDWMNAYYSNKQSARKVREAVPNPTFCFNTQDAFFVVNTIIRDQCRHIEQHHRFEAAETINKVVRYWWQFMTSEQRKVVEELVSKWAKVQDEKEKDIEERMCPGFSHWLGPDDYDFLEFQWGCVKKMQEILTDCKMDDQYRNYNDQKKTAAAPVLLNQFNLSPRIVGIIDAFGEQDRPEKVPDPNIEELERQKYIKMEKDARERDKWDWGY